MVVRKHCCAVGMLPVQFQAVWKAAAHSSHVGKIGRVADFAGVLSLGTRKCFRHVITVCLIPFHSS